MKKLTKLTSRLLNCLSFLTFLILNSSTSFCQKDSSKFEIGKKVYSKTFKSRNMILRQDDSIPIALYGLSIESKGKTPTEKSKNYLIQNLNRFGLDSEFDKALLFQSVKTFDGGNIVRYRQHYKGIRVDQNDILIKLNKKGKISMVANNCMTIKGDINIIPKILEKEALEIAKRHLEITKFNAHNIEKVIHFIDKKATLCYWIRCVTSIGEWEFFIDAVKGDILFCHDISLNATVNGTGKVFDLDPISSSGATYGTGGFVDNGDANSSDLENELINVTLLDITENNGVYVLKGPYAQVSDHECPVNDPTNPLYTQTSSDFSCTRDDDKFEAVMCYYYIDKSMRYLNSLGITVHPTYPGESSTALKFDPNGYGNCSTGTTEHNAWYTPTNQSVAFGNYGIDAAEDADVIIHELGHGIHDWITDGNLSNADGLSEGIGDYWAQSYSWSVGRTTHKLTPWFGHYLTSDISRYTNVTLTYPCPLDNFDFHLRGQIWATAMMSIYQEFGKIKTDKLMWEAIASTNSNTIQPMAATILYQTAVDNDYSKEELCFIAEILESKYGQWYKNVDCPNNYLILPPQDFTVTNEPNTLLGCSGMKLKSNVCPTNPPVVEMSVMEQTVDYVTFTYTTIPTTEVIRNLTLTEITALNNGTFSVPSPFTGTSGPAASITIQANKYYLVTIVNKGEDGSETLSSSSHNFHTKSGTHEYVMRDYNTDVGLEPNDISEDGVFKSPDLWNNVPANTNFTDLNQHQNPDPPTGSTAIGNDIRFNIRDMGCPTSSPSPNHSIRLFWTRARTDELWNKHWIYAPGTNGNVVTSANTGLPVPAGSEITIQNPTLSNPYNAISVPLTLSNITTGPDYFTQFGVSGTKKEWFPPDPSHYDVLNGSMSSFGNNPVICLLAVINDNSNVNDPIIWEPSGGWFPPQYPSIPIYPFVKNNNNVVTRNTMLVNDEHYFVDRGNGDWDYGFGTVWVNNDQGTIRNATLCIDLDETILPSDFTDYGRIEVGVTNGLWSGYLSSGNAVNMNVLSSTLFELTGTHGCLENIPVNPGDEEQIGLRFVYDGTATLPSTEEKYSYVLSATYGEDHGSNSVFEVIVPTTSPVSGSSKREPVNSLEKDISFIVYPNPAKNVFIVSSELPEETQYTIKFLDIQGRVLKQIEAKNRTKYFSHMFETQGYGTGIYYISLESGNVRTQRKVVIID